MKKGILPMKIGVRNSFSPMDVLAKTWLHADTSAPTLPGKNYDSLLHSQGFLAKAHKEFLAMTQRRKANLLYGWWLTSTIFIIDKGTWLLANVFNLYSLAKAPG